MKIVKNSNYVSSEYPKECRYCEHGKMSMNGKIVLCMKRGPVSPDAICKKYIYDPLKRTPKPKIRLKEYSEENFEI